MLKSTLALLIFFLFGFSAGAQDIIHLKSGEELNVQIIDISPKEIQYKKAENLSGPIYAVTMDQVASYTQAKDVAANNEEQLKKMNEQLNALQQKLKHDSLYLDSIRTQQKTLQEQNQALSATVSRLGGTLSSSLDSTKAIIAQQQKTIADQQDSLQSSVARMSAEINTIGQENTSQKEKDPWVPKPLAIGIDASGLLGFNPVDDKLGNNDYLPANVLFLSYSPGIHFRVEMELSASHSKIRDSTHVSSWHSYFALGFMGMKQRERGNFYAGFKIINFSGIAATFFVPTIGGEFIFGNRFSLGSEIGFPFRTTPASSNQYIVWPRLVFRYYLFNDVRSRKVGMVNSVYTYPSPTPPSQHYPQPSPQPTAQPYPKPSTHPYPQTTPQSTPQKQAANPGPQNDCASVKNGKFKMGNNTITRNGDSQTQLNKSTGLQTEYQVTWLSDCEYQLTPVGNASKKIDVKILSVDSGGYYCSYYDPSEKQAYRMRVDRVTE